MYRNIYLFEIKIIITLLLITIMAIIIITEKSYRMIYEQ
jgi:hypothetical protein